MKVPKQKPAEEEIPLDGIPDDQSVLQPPAKIPIFYEDSDDYAPFGCDDTDSSEI